MLALALILLLIVVFGGLVIFVARVFSIALVVVLGLGLIGGGSFMRRRWSGGLECTAAVGPV